MDESGAGHEPAKVVVRVLPMPVFGNVKVCFLSMHVVGAIKHWHKGRSVYCPGISPPCPPALHCGRTFFWAYAPVLAFDQISAVWLPRVAELTSSCEELVRNRLLRGEVWMFNRSIPGDKTSQVEGCLLETRDTSALPPAFEIEGVLQRVTPGQKVYLGFDNPTPSRVLMADFPMPAPDLSKFGSVIEPEPTPRQHKSLVEEYEKRGRANATNGHRPGCNGEGGPH